MSDAMFEDAREFAAYHRETFLAWLTQRREREARAARRADTALHRVTEFARRVGGPFVWHDALEAAGRSERPTRQALRDLVAAGRLRVVGHRPAGRPGPDLKVNQWVA